MPQESECFAADADGVVLRLVTEQYLVPDWPPFVLEDGDRSVPLGFPKGRCVTFEREDGRMDEGEEGPLPLWRSRAPPRPLHLAELPPGMAGWVGRARLPRAHGASDTLSLEELVEVPVPPLPAPSERGSFACCSEGHVAHLLGPAPEGAWTDPARVMPTERCLTFRFRRGAWRRDWTVGNATLRLDELPEALGAEIGAVTWSVSHGLVDGVLCDRLSPQQLFLRVEAERERRARVTAPLPPLDPELLGVPFRSWLRRSADYLLADYGGSLSGILESRAPGQAEALDAQVLDALAAAFDDLDRAVVAWRILHPEADTLNRERLARHLGVSDDELREREVGLFAKVRGALRRALREALGG